MCLGADEKHCGMELQAKKMGMASGIRQPEKDGNLVDNQLLNNVERDIVRSGLAQVVQSSEYM